MLRSYKNEQKSDLSMFKTRNSFKIKGLEVFKSHGTDDQMAKYLDKLSRLIGENIEFLENRNIRFKNAELDIDNALEAITASIRG